VPNAKTESGCGPQLLGLLACLAVIVFLFLGTEIHREIFFAQFGSPSFPKAPYPPVRVISSVLESSFWGADRYVVTLKRGDSPAGNAGEDSLVPGLVYTADCAVHFWNLCSALVPDQDYYGRWSSSKHDQIIITEVHTNEKGPYMDVTKTMRFKVRGWKRMGE
jgi:hypothetical protein